MVVYYYLNLELVNSNSIKAFIFAYKKYVKVFAIYLILTIIILGPKSRISEHWDKAFFSQYCLIHDLALNQLVKSYDQKKINLFIRDFDFPRYCKLLLTKLCLPRIRCIPIQYSTNYLLTYLYRPSMYNSEAPLSLCSFGKHWRNDDNDQLHWSLLLDSDQSLEP